MSRVDGENNADEDKVAVGSYTRSNGNKVTEHTRGAPGTRKRDAAEGSDAQGNDAEKRAKQEDGGGLGTAPVGRGLTVEEYLQLDLQQMSQAIIDAKVAKDPLLADAVAKDEAARQAKDAADSAFVGSMMNASQQQDSNDKDKQAQPDAEDKGGEQEEESGVNRLIADLEAESAARGNQNHDILAIVKRAKEGGYAPDSHFGPRSLVPHLQMAGLDSYARAVMQGQYKLW